MVSGDAQAKLLRDVSPAEDVAGSVVLSTCNRVEVYADVGRFHGGVSAVCELLARHSGLSAGRADRVTLRPLRGPGRAAPVRGRLRPGLDGGRREPDPRPGARGRQAGQASTARSSRELSDLTRLALRAGKRAHAETGIDAAGAEPGQRRAWTRGGAARGRRQPGPRLDGLRVLVDRRRVDELAGGRHGHPAGRGAGRDGQPHPGPGRAARRRPTARPRPGLAELPAQIAAADLVVSCTGAPGHVITARHGPRGRRARGTARPSADTPLVLLDLALPRDVDPAAAALPGVRLIDLETIGSAESQAAALDGSPAAVSVPARAADVAAVRRIVAAGARRVLAGRPGGERGPDGGRAARQGRDGRRGRAGQARAPARRRPGRANQAGDRPDRWAGSPTSCCTARPCGSRSWRARRARSPTRARCACCSSWIQRPSQAVGRPDAGRGPGLVAAGGAR